MIIMIERRNIEIGSWILVKNHKKAMSIKEINEDTYEILCRSKNGNLSRHYLKDIRYIYPKATKLR